MRIEGGQVVEHSESTGSDWCSSDRGACVVLDAETKSDVLELEV